MTTKALTIALLSAAVLAAGLSAAEPDILINDFEADGYGDWKATGEAFGTGPARGSIGPQMKVTGFLGKGLVNSFVGKDPSTGTLTSPPLTIERDHINFLIGGGMHPGKTCINLLVDGKVVRTATGPNDRPGGSERLGWTHWDVKDLKGQSATLQIVDKYRGGWGHISVDHIVQSDTPAGDLAVVPPRPREGVPPFERTRDIAITGTYLLVPIKNGGVPPFRGPDRATMQILDVFVGDTLVHSPNVYLAHRAEDVDWWANLDLSDYVGRTARLRLRLPGWAAAAHCPDDTQALDLIETSDAMRHLQPLYDEPMRPQFHHSQKRGWNNDPNGMVYYDGEYHLFWQSNPVGTVWANMYWGHSVSPDMIHWKELRPALRPNGQGVDGRAVANRFPAMAVGHCHSGGGNVDLHNTGGFQTGENKVMVLTFTDTGPGRARTFPNFSECLAYSNDKGRTWTYWEGNPIIRHLGRDPKLFWYEPGRHWNIAVYDEKAGSRGIAFYRSTDLKTWERTGRIDGFFECPEVLHLPVDGDPDRRRWVMFAADGKYVVGEFDGRTFTPAHEGKRRLFFGPVYAGQCFSNPPDGRAVYIAWARIGMGDAPFAQGFTLPLNLTLHTTPAGIRMRGYPIRELDGLHDGELFAAADRTLSGDDTEIACETDARTADIRVTVRPAADAKTVSLTFADGAVVYDVPGGYVRGTARPDPAERRAAAPGDAVTLRVVIDRPMVEVFLNGGETYLLRRREGKPLGKIALKTQGRVEEFRIFNMKSIWK